VFGRAVEQFAAGRIFSRDQGRRIDTPAMRNPEHDVMPSEACKFLNLGASFTTGLGITLAGGCGSRYSSMDKGRAMTKAPAGER
jgi:hypothetical protein